MCERIELSLVRTSLIATRLINISEQRFFYAAVRDVRNARAKVLSSGEKPCLITSTALFVLFSINNQDDCLHVKGF